MYIMYFHHFLILLPLLFTPTPIKLLHPYQIHDLVVLYMHWWPNQAPMDSFNLKVTQITLVQPIASKKFTEISSMSLGYVENIMVVPLFTTIAYSFE